MKRLSTLKTSRTTSAAIAFLSMLAAAAAAEPLSFKGRVIAIIDGDTIDVLRDRQPERVRLFDIDAPERGQAFGARARQFVAGIAFRQIVTVVEKGRDRFGRLLGNVTFEDGKSLNRELLINGFAWHFKRYSTDPALAKLELEARRAKRGLWADENPIAPWDYREQRRLERLLPTH